MLGVSTTSTFYRIPPMTKGIIMNIKLASGIQPYGIQGYHYIQQTHYCIKTASTVKKYSTERSRQLLTSSGNGSHLSKKLFLP